MVKILLALVFMLIASSAWAYIDPGTGMTFVSGLGAFIVGFLAIFFGALIVTFKKWIHWFKQLFSKITGKRKG